VSAGKATDLALGELRTRLALIDRSLVLSLVAREEAQREILTLKRASSLPLVDREREREVRRRARAWAREFGGDPDLAAHVLQAALESGKRRFFRARGAPLPGAHAAALLFQDPEIAPRSRPRDGPRIPVLVG